MTYESLIIKPGETDKIKHHDMSAIKKLGTARKYLDKSLLEQADTRVIVRRLDGNTENSEQYMNPHTHDVNQIYLFIGEPGDLVFEMHLGGETHTVESPCTAFIPAGLEHWEKYIRGKGYLVTVLGKGSYP